MQLKSLLVGYRHKEPLIKDVNIALPSAQLVALIGSNGSGKSTLLRTIAALHPVQGGDVVLGGRSVKDYSRQELAQLVAVVLTERSSFLHITVRELVAMGRSPYTNHWGSLSAADEKIIDEALRLIGIESLSSRFIDTLSDGEYQKTMIAKAIAQQTQFILLDEPTAFLDFGSKVELLSLLQRLAHGQGKTIILSTHDLPLALRLCDSLWLINPDRSITEGTPQALQSSEALQALVGQQAQEYL